MTLAVCTFYSCVIYIMPIPADERILIISLLFEEVVSVYEHYRYSHLPLINYFQYYYSRKISYTYYVSITL